MFADVLVEMESAGRAMAAQADCARSARLTCEEVYDRVMAESSSKIQ